MPLEVFLRGAVPLPAYQRLAPVAAVLRAKGRSDHSIAVEFRVTDKTIGKAIRWLRTWVSVSASVAGSCGGATVADSTTVANTARALVNPYPRGHRRPCAT